MREANSGPAASRRTEAAAPTARPERARPRRTDFAATRIAAVLAFAVIVASGASVHALAFWAAALFLMVRFGDLEGLAEDDGDRR